MTTPSDNHKEDDDDRMLEECEQWLWDRGVLIETPTNHQNATTSRSNDGHYLITQQLSDGQPFSYGDGKTRLNSFPIYTKVDIILPSSPKDSLFTILIHNLQSRKPGTIKMDPTCIHPWTSSTAPTSRNWMPSTRTFTIAQSSFVSRIKKSGLSAMCVCKIMLLL
jgi:hypothetical protein